MNRWSVNKTKNGFAILFGGPKWEVRKPDGKLVLERFETHAEALAHADRLARTVEVTLPRDALYPTKRHIYAGGLLMERDTDRCLYMAPGERMPVALAILAREKRDEYLPRFVELEADQ